MRVDELKRITEAPLSGQYLIYTRKKVLFDGYTSIDQVKQLVNDQQILEIHLFDKAKEYRAISTESKRFENGVIEWIADFDGNAKLDVFKDEMKLDSSNGTLAVLNQLKYDELGMASICDYRLVMGGENA